MNDYPEKKIITTSMFVLFLSLMIIYLLLFNIKGDQLKNKLESPTSNDTNITTEEINHNDENTKPTNWFESITTLFDTYTWDTKTTSWITNQNTTNIATWEQKNTSWDDKISIFNDNMNQVIAWEITIDNSDDIYILSGTERYFGALMTIEKLWIDYKYALKDDRDIYYIALDVPQYDFDKIVRELSWTTYKLTTEQDILNNNLFGDKITFINIPEFKDKIVIMLIEIHNMKRLVQISYDIYYESKWHLAKILDR